MLRSLNNKKCYRAFELMLVDFIFDEFFVGVEFVFNVLEFLLFLKLKNVYAVLELAVVASRLVQVVAEFPV